MNIKSRELQSLFCDIYYALGEALTTATALKDKEDIWLFSNLRERVEEHIDTKSKCE